MLYTAKDIANYVQALSLKKEKSGHQVFRGDASFTIKGTAKVGETKVFEMSQEVKDRHGDIVVLKGGILDQYNLNPVVLSMHGSDNGRYSEKPYDWDQVVGKGRAYLEGGKLLNAIDFEPKTINATAWKIESKIEFGSVRAGSIGIIPLEGHWGIEDEGEDTGTFYITKWILIEFSIVVIPANPYALVQESTEKKKTKKKKKEKSVDVPMNPNIGATAVLLASRNQFL